MSGSRADELVPPNIGGVRFHALLWLLIVCGFCWIMFDNPTLTITKRRAAQRLSKSLDARNPSDLDNHR